MKFHQVETGQRFLYRDQVYIKVSPVIARHEQSGEQKFLRRADSVQLMADEGLPAAPAGVRKHIEVKKVSALFDDFYKQCSAIIDAQLGQLPASERDRVRARIEQGQLRRNYWWGWADDEFRPDEGTLGGWASTVASRSCGRGRRTPSARARTRGSRTSAPR